MSDANRSCQVRDEELSHETPSAHCGGEDGAGRPAALKRRLTAVAGRLLTTWRDVVHLQRCLLDHQRPWERQGPLRWKRELGGWRLLGAVAPEDETSGSPASSGA